jgi:hypothetical protein
MADNDNRSDIDTLGLVGFRTCGKLRNENGKAQEKWLKSVINVIKS